MSLRHSKVAGKLRKTFPNKLREAVHNAEKGVSEHDASALAAPARLASPCLLMASRTHAGSSLSSRSSPIPAYPLVSPAPIVRGRHRRPRRASPP